MLVKFVYFTINLKALPQLQTVAFATVFLHFIMEYYGYLHCLNVNHVETKD